MKPESRFSRQDKGFWAGIRTVSELVGYSKRGHQEVLAPDMPQIESKLREAGLARSLVAGAGGEVGDRMPLMVDYFQYRAQVLNDQVESKLMDVDRAKELFLVKLHELSPTCPIPMNKQKGEKKAQAYLTGLVNMLIEKHIGERSVDYDPRGLISFTKGNHLVRTFSRRYDGAFPSTQNPIAVWEIKEYYYTTTFGSRVADGIYETLLDGMEIEEMKQNEDIDVLHYLFVDSHFTWWRCGRSYLCRIIDMLNMGYVDEVLFGSEVVEELPRIVEHWSDIHQPAQQAATPAVVPIRSEDHSGATAMELSMVGID